MKIDGKIEIYALCSLLLLGSCGTIQTEKNPKPKDDISSLPAYSGPRHRVQLVRLAIPDEIVKKYPELAEKRVGWGVYEGIADSFYETGRFSFIEEGDAIREKILQQWELSLSGLVATNGQDDIVGLEAPEYLVYAEIFDFAVSGSETVAAAASSKTLSTIVGVQLRLVRVADGSFVPASGIGEAESTSLGLWAPSLAFDQSTVGIATRKALRSAVASLVKRMG
jgi:hypothetical protein